MEKILVAIDGSTHANKALAITASLAKEKNASVIVVHSISDKSISPETRAGMEVEFAHEIEERLQSLQIRQPVPDESQYARTLLTHSSEVVEMINTLAGEQLVKKALAFLHENKVNSVESVLAFGDPDDQIVKTAREHGVETVVMGFRGIGKLQGLLMGSVSQSVAHDLDCTVVVVK